MVWTYHNVEELRKKYQNDEEISVEQKRKLEKYIRIKQQVAHHPTEDWSETQLHRAEFLYHKINQEQEKIEVETQ